MISLRMKRAVLSISSILVLLVILAVPGAGASPNAPLPFFSSDADGEIITSAQDVVKVEASRPWTEEEMKDAIPYPLPKVSSEMAALMGLDEQGPDGPPGMIPGQLPEGWKAIDPLANEFPEELAVPSAITGYGYPGPFTRLNVFTGLSGSNSYTVWPYITVGKLFFRQRGVSYVCSAASIGNYAIWTAGHCVHDGSNSSAGWSTNVSFVPGYYNGSAPLGQWTASWLATKTAWYQSGNLSYDMGAAVLYTRNGKKISQVVGNWGFAWNQGRNHHWNLFGYPQGSPFNGQYMITCQASYAYAYNPPGTGPNASGVGCDMTGGSSGGPWVKNFAGTAGSNNYLNGNTSFRRTSYPKELFSPYFDNSAKSLWDYVVTRSP